VNLVVGVADMQVSKDGQTTLVTYSLGSCLAVCIHDPTSKVGGLLHLMLPESKIDPVKAQYNPAMFADTGIPLLFREAYKLGAAKNRLEVSLFGAAQILDSSGVFNIGKRNYLAARKILWKNNILIKREEVGGTVHRTVWLDVASGGLKLRVAGRKEKEL